MSAHTLLLQQFSLLRLLSAEALEQIAPLATLRDFAKREMVLTKGPPVPFLCFLMEGRLQAIDFTLDGREVGLYFIEEGDYFGELSLIDGGSQPEFVIATLILLFLSAGQFFQFGLIDPQFIALAGQYPLGLQHLKRSGHGFAGEVDHDGQFLMGRCLDDHLLGGAGPGPR